MPTSGVSPSGLPAYGLLAVRSSSDPVHVTWTGLNGVTRTDGALDPGPCFFEDTEYRLHAKSLVPRLVPVLIHRDPHLLQEIDRYDEDLMCAGALTFHRQVGKSTLTLRVGHDSLAVTIHVFPTKLNYEEDYLQILSEVVSICAGLGLEYLRATYLGGSTEQRDHTSALEWLTLLRNELNELDKAVTQIAVRPHRALSPESQDSLVHSIKRPTPLVLRALLLGKGFGPYVNVEGLGRARTTIPVVANRDSTDTPENRWLRANLEQIRIRLARMLTRQKDQIGGLAELREPLPARVQAEATEVGHFNSVLNRLIGLPFLSRISSIAPPSFTSLTLFRGLGYSHAYHAITLLRHGLSILEGTIEYSAKDLHDLYEMWCFVTLVDAIASETHTTIDLHEMLEITETGLRVRLERGQRINFESREPAKRIELIYGPSYSGLTGDQRPDIVLKISHDGWPDLLVVFDAKYRVDFSSNYRELFGAPGPPRDAVNALHRYRDAIVTDTLAVGLQRPVVKGAALFPLAGDEAERFRDSPLYLSLSILGIGALPFLPKSTTLVKQWLRDLISMTPELLAESGPPFAGIVEKYRRETLGEN